MFGLFGFTSGVRVLGMTTRSMQDDRRGITGQNRTELSETLHAARSSIIHPSRYGKRTAEPPAADKHRRCARERENSGYT